MRIIIAPDSFKGSVSAVGVAAAMADGFADVFPQAEIKQIPIADGGEGTAEALVAATGGRLQYETVMGPLGDPVMAGWGVLGDGQTAVVEMAAASGLTLVPQERRDPRLTTTYGTGQLIKAALDQGFSRIIIGLGGSATNDGGAGMARALGVQFFDAAGNTLPDGGAALINLARIDISGLDPRLTAATIIVASDVVNPLCGPTGASAVFGPQKGATPAMVAELDAALANYEAVAGAATGKRIADYPGAGAAGGLGAGLLLFTPAQFQPGIDVVLAAADFAELAATADLVITGEGCTDYQTAYGKAPVGVAKAAKQFGVPVVCLSGSLGNSAAAVYEQGIDSLMSIVPRPLTLAECMEQGPELIKDAAVRLARVIKAGMKIRG
jgi:glycerate kinase